MFKVEKHSLFSDKFTRLFYLLIRLVQAANYGRCRNCVSGDISQTPLCLKF